MIAVVVPTVAGREEVFAGFMAAWQPLFNNHAVTFVRVTDGEMPSVEVDLFEQPIDAKTINEIMDDNAGAISNFNGGVRNLGFAYIAKYVPQADIIMTLDDDTRPIGDTIQDHLDALERRVPISWVSTASEYMRGFPYGVREEAEVVLSHGVWENVADWDAPTQLVMGSTRKVDFPKMPIPKGIYYPMCGMNIAFKRKMLQDMYQAPFWLEQGIGRVDDIICGIYSKQVIDSHGWAAVTGYARVWHERASNVYKNLKLEAASIELFEQLAQGDESHPYFDVYKKKRAKWDKFFQTLQ
jgi:reversibly glycosylated polypeptide/UDP-arabinopyranose mutase